MEDKVSKNRQELDQKIPSILAQIAFLTAGRTTPEADREKDAPVSKTR